MNLMGYRIVVNQRRRGGPEREDVLMAAIMNFTLFKFFISQRVPEPGDALIRFMETFMSQRSDPYKEKRK